MIIKNLRLDGFRNYEDLNINFSENINVITGRNAQGKTNLLEAMYILSLGRSFRTRTDKDIIGFDKDIAFIEGTVFSGERDNEISVRLVKGKKKSITVNDVKLRSFSELAGRLNVVLFCPDDLNIIRDGAAARRKFLDDAISQLRPAYSQALSEYSKAYESKLRILKDYHEKPSLLDTLDEFNHAMAVSGAKIIRHRAAYLQKLIPAAAEIHSDFSSGREIFTGEYKTVSTVTDASAPAQIIYEQLMNRFNSLKRAEIDSETCLTGIHKDDCEIMINGHPARNFASQGQTRTAALSLKLAEREISAKDTGENPVLLLDDVLSELDAARQNYILNRITGGQVFITCCEDEDISGRTGGTVFSVENGTIKNVSAAAVHGG